MTMPKELPDFLIIGAAKSGTTSLFYYLAQHPEICVPRIKELNYFSNFDPDSSQAVGPGIGPGDVDATEWTSDIDKYSSYFRHCGQATIKGEASVSYLYSPYAAANIKTIIPEIRLILMLRNPVDRAWSQYQHMIRDGRETLDFDAALAAEQDRIKKGWEFSWHYRSLGFYALQIERYLKFFPLEQMHIILFEDFINNPLDTVSDVANYLGLSSQHTFKIESAHNRTGTPKSRLFSRIVNQPSPARNWLKQKVPPKFGHYVMEMLRQANIKTSKPELPESARLSLLTDYKRDIVKLEELIQRDLSAWYQESNS